MADLETEIEHYKELQIFGMKLKVGKLSVEQDIERTHRARKIGGPQFHLCTDSNQSWTVEEAIQFARGVRELNLAWLEEPVRWHDQIDGNARVRTIGIPVNAGQGEISRHGCRDLVVRGAVDILNVDATIAAGVTEWRRIAGMRALVSARRWPTTKSRRLRCTFSQASPWSGVEIFPNYKRDPMWFDLPEQQPGSVTDSCNCQRPGIRFTSSDGDDRKVAGPQSIEPSLCKRVGLASGPSSFRSFRKHPAPGTNRLYASQGLQAHLQDRIRFDAKAN